MELYNTYFSVPGFLCSTLRESVKFTSSLYLWVFIVIAVLMGDTWVLSTEGLFQAGLQWTFSCVAFGARTHAFLLATCMGQRWAICLPFADTDKQVFNMVVLNVNILNYFPVDLMPHVVTTNKSVSIWRQPLPWLLSAATNVLHSISHMGRDQQILI